MTNLPPEIVCRKNSRSTSLEFPEAHQSYSVELEPFYLGYAHEALARAAKLAGDPELLQSHKEAALNLVGDIGTKDEQDLLLKDLASI
jgi:hypothetical protein